MPLPEVGKRPRFDYLLGLLQEEASEITVEVSKCLRFGLTEQYTPDHPINIDRVRNEVQDLLTVINIIERDYGIDLGLGKPDVAYRITKEDKIEHYLGLSHTFGLVDNRKR
ncbi:hypothetical protein [Vibrio phage RYC]|nr:hypothetical protein [Vibrio phage RYC]